jgi:2-dehydro-3-deoxyphosphooctonate aldolase (KDO 8-P synthase)
VIEGEGMALDLAGSIRDLARAADFDYCFKASWDKANRTNVKSSRGPGFDEGLRILGKVREEIGVPVLTDFHAVDQADDVAKVVDVLQVPAFLCRQTDLLEAAAATGKAVNVKKGQFLAPEDMAGVVEKLHVFGCRDILLTERGSTFGYHNLVVDFRGLPIMRKLGHPVVFDATHSTQRPGGLGHMSGGNREEAPLLASAAAAVGVDGLFLEVHHDPENAQSDAATQLPLAWLESLLPRLRAIDDLRRTRGS